MNIKVRFKRFSKGEYRNRPYFIPSKENDIYTVDYLFKGSYSRKVKIIGEHGISDHVKKCVLIKVK